MARPTVKLGERSIQVSIRLPESLHARIAQAVEDKNERAIKAGFRPVETVVTMTRDALAKWAEGLPVLNGHAPTKRVNGSSVPPVEPETDDASNGHSDEVTMRPSLPRLGRKMLRPTDGTFAVPQQMTPEEARAVRPPVEGEGPTAEPTDEELAAILEGTPGL